MNTKLFAHYVTLLATALLLSSCVRDACQQEVTYIDMIPVYGDMAEVRTQVGPEASRTLENPGKLYFKDHYVFIGEVNEGIHIIDNLDPNNPRNIGFIRVPGVRDMAVRGSIMYVDSYMDLVAIDITDPTNAQEVGREQDVFPYGSWHPGLWAEADSGIALYFEEREVTEAFDCNDVGGGFIGRRNFFEVSTLAAVEFTNEVDSDGGSDIPSGIGGSMARFTLVSDYLYVVTDRDLQAYHLANPTSPNQRSTQSIGWGDIETIFPMKDHLFIGSMNGMYIYSIDNPSEPSYISEMQHMQACDPVVVEGDYAFVTLKGGNACGSWLNQLDVVNISDIRSPRLEASYPMHGPNGLGIKDGTLFICDGDEGLKVYDASDVNTIDQNQIAHFPDIHAFDVIPLTSILLLIGDDGFYQYDFSNLEDIQLLSTIEVEKS